MVSLFTVQVTLQMFTMQTLKELQSRKISPKQPLIGTILAQLYKLLNLVYYSITNAAIL